jgi:hypothetical protein
MVPEAGRRKGIMGKIAKASGKRKRGNPGVDEDWFDGLALGS